MYKYLIILLVLLAQERALGQSAAQDSLRVFNELDSVLNIKYQADPAEALMVVQRLDSIASFLGQDSLKMRRIADNARVMVVLGFADDAMEGFFTSLKMAEKLKLPWHIAKLNYNIAIAYQTMLGDYTRAYDHIKTAYNVAVSNKLYKDTTFYNYAIAENMVMQGKTEEGIALLEENVANAKKTNRYIMILGGLETLAFIYYKTGQNERSYNCMYEVLPYLPAINNDYQYLVCYIHIAEMAVETSRWDTAVRYVQLAHKYAPIVNSADWYYELYSQEANIYYHQKDYRKTLRAHSRFSRYKDSVLKKSYNNKIAALTAKYGLEKKQAQIAMLQKDNALHTATVGQHKMQRNATMLASTLMIVVVVTTFRGRMNRKTKDMREAFSRELIRTQEEDKQRIAREMHDGIGQNILFIRNQVAMQADDETKARLIEAIDSTIADVRNISKDLYPNQLDKYGLAAAINALAEKTMEMTGVFVSADLEAIAADMTPDVKIGCYRIIQECITNTVKHADARAIRIEGELQKDRMLIVVKDNGKGFDVGTIASKAQSSFGLLSMDERARMMGGKLDIDSSDAGTIITITLPLVANAA